MIRSSISNTLRVSFTCIALLGLFSLSDAADATVEDGTATRWIFADEEQAASVIAHQDEFVRRLSPFDRAARLKTSSDVSEERYLSFVANCIESWSEADRSILIPLLTEIERSLADKRIEVPDQVLLIKTSGDEEGGAAYTRGNAIVLPAKEMKSPPAKLKRLLLHELFHVISRAQPKLRNDLYAVIGFQPCGELLFPEELAHRKLTNPDAVIEHCIEIQVDGKPTWAVPILYASVDQYDERRGGEFFSYLTFKLLVIDRNKTDGRVVAARKDAQPQLIDPGKAKGFMEQIGRNTGYIIHPEEILADNFILMVLDQADLRSPEIVRSMRDLITSSQSPASNGN